MPIETPTAPFAIETAAESLRLWRFGSVYHVPGITDYRPSGEAHAPYTVTDLSNVVSITFDEFNDFVESFGEAVRFTGRFTLDALPVQEWEL
jgi:hypothetical protein